MPQLDVSVREPIAWGSPEDLEKQRVLTYKSLQNLRREHAALTSEVRFWRKFAVIIGLLTVVAVAKTFLGW